MPMPPPVTDREAAERLLARHAERRRQGLATVSVLVGSPDAARATWDRHTGGRVPIVIERGEATDPAAVVGACLRGACRTAPLLTAAVIEVGRRLGRPQGQVLAGRTAYDLEQLWQLVPTDGSDADRDLLSAIRLICAEPVERWAAGLTAALPGWRAVPAVGQLLAEGRRWPPAWVDGGDAAWLAAAAGPLAGLAAADPRWPIGVGVSAEVFPAFASAAGAGRAETLFAGGGVVVGDTAATAADVDRPRRVRSDPDDAARSAAERHLFAAVERRWPGLFALNRPLGFNFGLRPAEADLFAASLRLVVEVDGYHHFQRPHRYRRDRHKDWLYQAHGYHCRRFLADDVVPRLPAILDDIAVAVDHCRRHPMGAGQTAGPP
jgi:very-short-patch-repair endonuclease